MNTTKYRWWRLLAIVFAFTLIAAACGDDDKDEPSASQSDDMAGDDMAGDDMAGDDMAGDGDDMAGDGDDMAGDGDDMAGDGDDMAHISDECNIPNPAENVEIDVMGWEFPIVTQYAEELDDCEEGNYSFNYQFLDSQEARSAMTQDAASGSPSFELYQGSNAFISELANQGFVMPLNDLVDKYRDEFNLDQIDPAF